MKAAEALLAPNSEKKREEDFEFIAKESDKLVRLTAPEVGGKSILVDSKKIKEEQEKYLDQGYENIKHTKEDDIINPTELA